MKNLPYLSSSIWKQLTQVTKKGYVVLNTHSANFHADDICATATLRTFLKLAYPKIKIKLIRTLDPKRHAEADFVYDIGMIYDPAKLRFDHHQVGGAGVYANGLMYSSFGLIWKHFGPTICALFSENRWGKKISKKVAERQAEIIAERVVSHIDGMDNGQMTFKTLYPGTDVLTLDSIFEMIKTVAPRKNANNEEANKDWDSAFVHAVKLVEDLFEVFILFADKKEGEEDLAIKAYSKSKDKRIIICEKFYHFNFGKFPEPLVVVFPHPRGSWAAKVVRKSEGDYDARFYFPKSWAGRKDQELEKVSGVKGATFCHNARFMVAANTKEAVLEMVHKALGMGKV